jgi:2-phosphosulfolactate phosphatase
VTHGQTQYQVRFDWGRPGADAIGEGADVVVWVDVLGTPATPQQSATPPGPATQNKRVAGTTIAGSLRNRRAIADWALAKQGDKGDRFTIAVVAAGDIREDGSIRFAVEDLLAAGAVIDALADVGIDYCSPEAAAASAAFMGLKNATGHLIGASASGRELAENGRRAEVDLAIQLDATGEIEVL